MTDTTPKVDLDRLKQAMPIMDLAKSLGLEVRGRQARCFNSQAHAHNDHNFSLGLDTNRNRLRHTKSNFGILRDEQPLRLIFTENIVQIEKGDMASDPSFIEHLPTDQKIEKSLEEDGVATAKTLAERLGVNSKTVANVLSKLKGEGKIKEEGKEGHAPIYALANFPSSLSLVTERREEKFDQNLAIEATTEWIQQMREPGEEG